MIENYITLDSQTQYTDYQQVKIKSVFTAFFTLKCLRLVSYYLINRIFL